MAKTVFFGGTVVTSAYLNALQNIQFDDANLDGHYPRLGTDSFVDSVKDSIDYRLNNGLVSAVDLGVSPNVSVLLFSFLGAKGELNTLSATELVTNEGVQYVCVVPIPGGLYEFRLEKRIPSMGIVLAQVTTTAGVVTGVVDYRNQMSFSVPDTVEIFGGNSTQDLLITSTGTDSETEALLTLVNPTMSGVFEFNNITVESGATLTSEGFLLLKARGSVVFELGSTTTVNPTITGGNGYQGTVAPNNSIFPVAGSGLGGARGHNVPPANAYSFLVSSTGSGGCTGLIKVRLTGTGSLTYGDFTETCNIDSGNAGSGGGALIIEAVSEVSLLGTINCAGGIGDDFSYIGGLTANQFLLAGGNGGGSGGSIVVSCLSTLTLGSSSLFNVQGGDGGQGYVSANVSTTYGARGGGGGGGGHVALYYSTLDDLGASFTLSGGVKGATTGTGTNYLAGGIGGSFGGLGGASDSDGSPGTLTTTPI